MFAKTQKIILNSRDVVSLMIHNDVLSFCVQLTKYKAAVPFSPIYFPIVYDRDKSSNRVNLKPIGMMIMNSK